MALQIDFEVWTDVSEDSSTMQEDDSGTKPVLYFEETPKVASILKKADWAIDDLRSAEVVSGLVRFLILLGLTLHMVVHEDVTHDIFMARKSMEQIYIHSINTEYKHINDVAGIWNYMLDTMLPQMKITSITQVYSNITIRQIRNVPRGDCVGSKNISVLRKTCKKIIPYPMEDTAGYTPNWEETMQESEDIQDRTIWHYSSREELYTPHYSGLRTVFPLGGYVFYVPKDWDNAKTELNKLRNTTWVDENTRALIVVFAMYNANTKSFNVGVFQFEFVDTGTIYPDYEFYVTDSNDIDLNSANDILLLCEFMFAVYLLVVNFRQSVINAWRSGISIWLYVEITNLLSGVLFAAVRLVQYLTRIELFEEFESKAMFSLFFKSQKLDTIYTLTTSAFILSLFAKSFKFLQFNPMYLLWVKYFLPKSVGFVAYFGTIMVTFSFTGFLLFGRKIECFKSFTVSLVNTARFASGDMQCVEMIDVYPISGHIYVVLFSIAAFAFKALMSAMTMLAFGQAIGKVSTIKKNSRVWSYIKSWFNLEYK